MDGGDSCRQLVRCPDEFDGERNMIVRMSKNSRSTEVEGFLYNVAGANVTIRFRTDGEYGMELEFDFCQLQEYYSGCVEEAMACLAGIITIGADEFMIDDICCQNLKERKLLHDLVYEEDWIDKESGEDFRHDWIRVSHL